MSEVCISQPSVAPDIIVAPGVNPVQQIDPRWASSVMRELGISDETIAKTSVYVDANSHYSHRGSAWPGMLARVRFRHIEGLRDALGPVVRLSTVMRGQPRSPEAIAETAEHEFVHVGQLEHDKRSLAVGWLGMVSLTAVGALVGNRITKNTSLSVRSLATLVGAAIGHHAGYTIAPHERKARVATGHSD